MDISRLVSIRNVEVNTKDLINQMRVDWLQKQFKIYEPITYTLNSISIYVLTVKTPLHSNDCFVEDIKITCNREQTAILKAFDLLAQL